MSVGSSSDPLSSLLAAYPCGTILLRDSLAASGHFLLPWLTAACLKQGQKVVFVAAAYSPAKHQAALKKLGLAVTAGAMQQQQQSSPLAFVSAADAVKQAEEQQQQQQSCLQILCQQVHAAALQLLGLGPDLKQQEQQQGLTVILDSLPCVSALSQGDARQVQALVHNLAALGEQLQVPYRLVLLAARDDAAQQQLLMSATAMSHVIADIAPLEGKTAALDGSMTIQLRKAPPQQQQQQAQSMPVSSSANVARPGWLCAGSSSVWFFRCGDVAVKWLNEVHGKELMG